MDDMYTLKNGAEIDVSKMTVDEIQNFNRKLTWQILGWGAVIWAAMIGLIIVAKPQFYLPLSFFLFIVAVCGGIAISRMFARIRDERVEVRKRWDAAHGQSVYPDVGV
jgi:hypothetical protein